ncbi:hypothetical protein [Caldilinea aerophila]|jgi:hypothetical protein|nr:hypothetical protein [Caldilinea aerophila]
MNITLPRVFAYKMANTLLAIHVIKGKHPPYCMEAAQLALQ